VPGYDPERSFDLLLEAVPFGASVHSACGRIDYANAQLAEIYGKDRSKIVGQRCSDVLHTELMPCPHELVVASGSCAELDSPATPEGRAYQIRVEPILGKAGEVLGFIRFTCDVTKSRQMREALVQAERFATLGQMISGVAHDIGTPLSIISGYAEYLLMRATPGEPGHKELTTILSQTHRIANVVRQLIELARPPRGRTDTIAIKGFIEETVEFMRHHLGKTGVALKVTGEIQPPIIYGDAPRLRQAFFNLILTVSNRVGLGGSVEVNIGRSGGREDEVIVVLRGADSSGEPLPVVSSLAELFAQAGRPSGLSLTQEILEEFGARVEAIVEGSNPGLAVCIPLTRTDSSPR
jgi:nitrogen fixation/metabolism regulation signal transduction histidine kinase